MPNLFPCCRCMNRKHPCHCNLGRVAFQIIQCHNKKFHFKQRREILRLQKQNPYHCHHTCTTTSEMLNDPVCHTAKPVAKLFLKLTFNKLSTVHNSVLVYWFLTHFCRKNSVESKTNNVCMYYMPRYTPVHAFF